MKTSRIFFKAIAVSTALLFIGIIMSVSVSEAQDNVKLSWWHLWGGSRTELVEKLASDYQKTHPNVEFEITFTPPNEMQKKVVQAAGTGSLPDVFTIHSGWYPLLQPQETLLNLDAQGPRHQENGDHRHPAARPEKLAKARCPNGEAQQIKQRREHCAAAETGQQRHVRGVGRFPGRPWRRAAVLAPVRLPLRVATCRGSAGGLSPGIERGNLDLPVAVGAAYDLAGQVVVALQIQFAVRTNEIHLGHP